jgi:hypothetical protein
MSKPLQQFLSLDVRALRKRGSHDNELSMPLSLDCEQGWSSQPVLGPRRSSPLYSSLIESLPRVQKAANDGDFR